MNSADQFIGELLFSFNFQDSSKVEAGDSFSNYYMMAPGPRQADM